MIAKVRAKYSNGVLTPLDPLNLKEGEIVVLRVETAPSKNGPVRESSETAAPGPKESSLLEMFKRIRESYPDEAWDDMPTDGAMNLDHYLYGSPKETER